MAQSFLPEHRISIAIAASSRTAGQTAINGAMVDMQGYEGVVAVVEMGTIASTAVTSIKWQQSDTTTAADFTDLERTGLAIADDADDEIFVSELVQLICRSKSSSRSLPLKLSTYPFSHGLPGVMKRV